LAYNAPLNFMASPDGNPLDFVSQIILGVAANAGPYDLGYMPGTFTAYIDPTILFNSGLNPADYSLEVGGLTAEFVDAPPPGVPEPATWAMLVLGLGAVGGTLRFARGMRTALLTRPLDRRLGDG
jgi:hypothetical protein